MSADILTKVQVYLHEALNSDGEGVTMPPHLIQEFKDACGDALEKQLELHEQGFIATVELNPCPSKEYAIFSRCSSRFKYNSTDSFLAPGLAEDNASEIIQMASISLMLGAKKSDFDNTMALHPTIAEEFVTMK